MTSEARSTPRAHHPRQPSRMRLFVSGGTGVLGRGLRPLAATAGHELVLPTHDQFDLFDPTAVAAAIRDADGSCNWRPGSARSSSARTNDRSDLPSERRGAWLGRDRRRWP